MARTKFIPLKDAPWTFASKRLQSARYAAQEASRRSSKSQLTELEARGKRASENPAEMSKFVTYLVNGMVEAWKDWSAPELAMAESLLQKLQEGKLEAFGVQSAPKQKRQLELIPSHFFMDLKINWNANKITNFGVTYSAVRVRRRSSAAPTGKASSASGDISSSTPAKTADLKASEATRTSPADAQTRALAREQESSEGQRQKPGPPSGAEAVIAAYEELRRTGALKDGMTIADIHRKLVRVLKSNTNAFPNGRGLAYASIARHLRPHLTGLSKFSS